MKTRPVQAVTAATALLVAVSGAAGQPAGSPSPVTGSHVAEITAHLRADGMADAAAILDRQGRVELTGKFRDEKELDRAFSLAQTVVGVRWVSPVTPEQLERQPWARALADIFLRRPPEADAPPGPVARKYALVVGVGQFRSGIQPLQYAGKDAYDVYSYLVDPAGGNFRRDNVVLLRDRFATRGNVLRALDEIKQRAQPDDLVLIYLSSHGTPPDKYGGVHVVTYDSEVVPRERIWHTSLTEHDLREFIESQRAKRLVVIMDACYSNGAYVKVAGFLPSGGKSLNAGGDDGHGRSRGDMARRLLGAKDLVVSPPVASTGAGGATDGPTGWGKILVSASDAGERSWESSQVHNSIFTYHFVRGLRAYRGALKPAFEHAQPLVREQVKREKGADIEQNPQLTPDRSDWNMSVAVGGR